MGLSIVGDASLLGAGAAHEPVSGEKYREKARDHLQKVLSGVLHVLAAASGDLGDLERATWHLQMACNYLKLAASETGTAEADAVDTARESLTDRFFLVSGVIGSSPRRLGSRRLVGGARGYGRRVFSSAAFSFAR